MFNIDTSKKTATEFNTNKLIIKSTKDLFVEKAIRPKEQKPTYQSIQPVVSEDIVGIEAIFEIY